MGKPVVIVFIVGALLGLSGAGEARAQEVAYSGSLQYATGSYFFTEQTGSLYLTNTLSVSGRLMNLSVTVPFITQDTPWISYTATGLLPTGGPGHDTVGMAGQGGHRGRMQQIDPGNPDTVNYTASSFGDPSLAGGVVLYRSPAGGLAIRGNGSVKLPLADPAGGFGTGAFDYSAGLSLTARLARTTFLALDGSYWVLGDMEELDFINPLGFSAGLGRSFADGKLMVMASLFGSSRIIEGIEPPLTAGLGLNYRVSSAIGLSGNAILGLSESASDFGIGAGWHIRL